MKSLQKLASLERGRYYALYVIAMVLGIVVISQAYLIVTIVDDLFLNKQTFDQIVPLLFVLLGVLILRASLSYLSGKLGVKMAARVKAKYRERLLDAYGNHSLLASAKGQVGSKMSVMLDAVDELDSFFSKYVPQRIITTVVPLMILLVVFSQHVYSGLIILLTAPFIPMFMAIVGNMTQRKSEEKLDSLKAFSGRFLDTIQGLESLKLYGRSKHFKDTIQKSSENFRDTTMGILKVAFTSSLMLEFISMLSIGLVALELGLRLVVFNEITFFTAFFILLLVPEFFNSLKELGSAFHSGRSSSGAAEKIEKELKQEVKGQQWGTRTLVKPVAVKLNNLEYFYESSDFRLLGIQSDLPAIGQVAIVGKSGSGKTTLLNVIAGLLQPTSGDVMVNESKLYEYKEQDWFSQIGYITQHPYLFTGTIAENISLGVSATKEEIEKASNQAGLTELIATLPNGDNTTIGEGGRGLSGGEKQRVALARAFLKKPSVVLFDEPTTGLDLKTEQYLHESIQKLTKTSLVITVAHRVQTIKGADHILLLDQGKLVGEGTHNELLATSEYYRTLFNLQGKEERQ
ncbi:thiol reductant ABC exporter subunit CydD [Halalkalibacter okhensis]|uniref:ABC transporter ATP-binding protein n=1 Tax=Halalkalibacter okhensis TaxID=333138 RepID=A0A0B0IFQ8_9BACI|nr:thiol reductant ABC exporter subunit CydD [Halalkalibacter okhensis]KHF41398.1 ABC transporter ATP-binding protein [Halalkalibacter okhensis]